MDMARDIQKRYFFLVLVCCLLRAVAASAPAHSTGNKVPYDRREDRIVGGVKETNEDVVQWQALFLGNGHVKCGGILVSYNKVITAGHCSINPDDEKMKVRIGALDVSGGDEYDVLSARDFPTFYRSAIGYPVNDLKIVEISNQNLRLGQKAVTVNSNPDLPADDTMMYVSGYGLLSEDGEVANHLRTAQVPTVSYNQCRPRYPELQQDANVCAGSGEKDACTGDSGGALWSFTRKNESVNSSSGSTITIYGVVSYGEGCANPLAPGVYTRVSTYHDWIQDQIELPASPQKQAVGTVAVLTKPKVIIASAACLSLLTLIFCGCVCYCWYTRQDDK